MANFPTVFGFKLCTDWINTRARSSRTHAYLLRILCELGLGERALDVDDEAVLDVAFVEPLVGIVHLLDRD